MASPTPVLPLVGSMMVAPGCNKPFRSAASIIATATRSFTLPPGLARSTLANSGRRRPIRDERLFRAMRGVWPMLLRRVVFIGNVDCGELITASEKLAARRMKEGGRRILLLTSCGEWFRFANETYAGEMPAYPVRFRRSTSAVDDLSLVTKHSCLCHPAAWCHVLRYPYVCTNHTTAANGDASEDGSVGVDDDVVLDDGMARNAFDRKAVFV